MKALEPPPPPPPPPPSAATIDLSTLPTDVAEAMTLAPDGGTVLYNTYQALLQERAGLKERWETMQAANRLGLETRSQVQDVLAGTTSGVLRDSRAWRVEERFRQQLHDWDALGKALARRTNKSLDALSLFSGDDFRQRREKDTLLYNALPVPMRVGGDRGWQMSLRNGWEQLIPVGNVFSGLFVALRELPPSDHKLQSAMETVRRSIAQQELEELRAPPAPGALRSRADRGRSWQNSEARLAREKDIRRYLRSFRPYTPQVDGMSVSGKGLAAELEATVLRELSLEDVLQRIQQSDPAYEQALREQLGSVPAGAEAAADEAGTVDDPQSAAASGPALQIDACRVAMHTMVGQARRAALCCSNTGSAALYYSWSRSPPCYPAPATGGTGPQRIYLADQSGVLLPGQSRTFQFTFKSDTPGIFTEIWHLATSPQLPSGRRPAAVVLRGVAAKYDLHMLQRRTLDAQLAQREKTRKVRAALEAALTGLATPRPAPEPQLPPSLEQQMLQWETENLDQPADAMLYYRPEVYEQMALLYTELHAALVPPQPPPDEGKKGKKGGKGKEVEPPPDPFPEEWNGHVAGLARMVQLLAGEAEAEPAEDGALQLRQDAVAAASLRERLQKLEQAARVPCGGRSVARFEARKALLQLADAVELAAAAAKQEAARLKWAQLEEHGGEELGTEVEGAANVGAAEQSGEEPALDYEEEEYLQLFGAAVRQAADRHVGRLTHHVQEALGKLAAHFDSRLAQMQQDASGAAEPEQAAQRLWQQFAWLRTRKMLKLPGGPDAPELLMPGRNPSKKGLASAP